MHAGIMWGLRLEAPESIQRQRIAEATADRSWAVFSEAQFYSCPRLKEFAHPSCKVYLSINGWAVFTNGSQYWPTHATITAVCNGCDGWLKNSQGVPLTTNWGLHIMDIRNKPVQDILITTTRDMLDLYNADGLFIDECYAADWPSVLSGVDLTIPLGAGGLGWTDAMRRIIRLIPTPITGINGTLKTKESVKIKLRYIQNFANKMNWKDILKEEMSYEYMGAVCIQVPWEQSGYWQAIAAQYPGRVYVQEIPPTGGQFDGQAPSLVINAPITWAGEQARIG